MGSKGTALPWRDPLPPARGAPVSGRGTSAPYPPPQGQETTPPPWKMVLNGQMFFTSTPGAILPNGL